MTDEIVRLRAERDAAVAALAEVRAALGVEGNGSVVLAVELLKRRAEQAESESSKVLCCELTQVGRVMTVNVNLIAGCHSSASAIGRAGSSSGAVASWGCGDG